MKKFTVSILGCGSRGLVYSELINMKKEFEITTLCDIDKEQIDKVVHRGFSDEEGEDFRNQINLSIGVEE